MTMLRQPTSSLTKHRLRRLNTSLRRRWNPIVDISKLPPGARFPFVCYFQMYKVWVWTFNPMRFPLKKG